MKAEVDLNNDGNFTPLTFTKDANGWYVNKEHNIQINPMKTMCTYFSTSIKYNAKTFNFNIL